MQDISFLIEKYKNIFYIPSSIHIEIQQIPQGQELIYIPEGNKAILKLDRHSIGDIPELMAQLKLGIDYHHLLATMYFQPDMTKEEEQFARSFYTLVIPVIDSWVWKVMKDYLPEDEMEKEIAELNKMWEDYQLYKMYVGDEESDYLRRRITLSNYLIRKVLDIPVKLQLIGKDKKLLQEWIRYKKALEKAVEKEPDINVLIEIPEITKAP